MKNLEIFKESEKYMPGGVNYKSLETVIDKYVAKLDEIDEDELSSEDIVNLTVVKDIIIDALIKIVDNGFLMDIDADDAIANIRKEEVEALEEEYQDGQVVTQEDETAVEEDNYSVDSESTQTEKVEKEIIESNIDKEEQLDIILTTLLNMKDNIDILREAFLKLYK